MKAALTFLLTKTKFLRYGAGLVISLLMGWGAVKAEDKEKATEAVTVLAVVVTSALIERKKDNDAKETQRDNGLRPDGWIGPVSRKVLKPRGGLFKG